nr:hypothetical protein Iba_chr13bCG12620 [Ipomoea batatas]
MLWQLRLLTGGGRFINTCRGPPFRLASRQELRKRLQYIRVTCSTAVTFVKRTGAAGSEDDGIGVGLFERGATESLKIELLGDKIGEESHGSSDNILVCLVLFLIRRVRPMFSLHKSAIDKGVIAAFLMTSSVHSILA